MYPLTWYEDKHFIYIWKPDGIPSSFWREYSFLELIFQEKQEQLPYIQHLKQQFSKEEERGLLNRLDTATSWLLYFAKSQKSKQLYKKAQSEWKIQKYYLAEVYGDIRYWIEKHWKVIKFPIAHHRYIKEKMVVITTDDQEKKAETKHHYVTTTLEEIEWNPKKQTTTLLVVIHKGIRHQIRCHLSAIWYPILWDPLYGKKGEKSEKRLHLWSVGMKMDVEEYLEKEEI